MGVLDEFLDGAREFGDGVDDNSGRWEQSGHGSSPAAGDGLFRIQPSTGRGKEMGRVADMGGARQDEFHPDTLANRVAVALTEPCCSVGVGAVSRRLSITRPRRMPGSSMAWY